MHEPMTMSLPTSLRLTRAGVALLVGSALFLTLTLLYLLGGGGGEGRGSHVNLKQLLAVSIDLARRGGEAVRRIRLSPSAPLGEKVKSRTREGADEFVTAADLESHRAMRFGFEKAFPGIKVISEERDSGPVSLEEVPEPQKILADELKHVIGTEYAHMDDVTVWIDPLDATQEYTENLTEYVTTMVCVALRGVPVIGVIHDPFIGKTSWGWVSHGMSPTLLHTDPSRDTRVKYRVVVSRSHAGTVSKQLDDAFGHRAEVVSAGGAGYKVLQILRGHADAYLHVTHIKKWDVCAGDALLRAAHGSMTTLDGEPIDYSAGGPPLVRGGLLATTWEQKLLHRLFLDRWADVHSIHV